MVAHPKLRGCGLVAVTAGTINKLRGIDMDTSFLFNTHDVHGWKGPSMLHGCRSRLLKYLEK